MVKHCPLCGGEMAVAPEPADPNQWDGYCFRCGQWFSEQDMVLAPEACPGQPPARTQGSRRPPRVREHGPEDPPPAVPAR